MDYKHTEITIKDLIHLIDNKLINLKPLYQRNFIWSSNDQKYLIDSILSGFPLPNFFVYQLPDSKYEMVDGQQRARTIYRFYNGIITTTDKLTINEINKELFLNYRLNWAVISNLKKTDSLETFYVLVNKRGKHLNAPELIKAEYHSTTFLFLVEELLDLQEMINLDLFSDATSKRMNDRSFIEELVAYLKVDITDKKEAIERIYQLDIDDDEFEELKKRFTQIIKKINILNEIRPINKTRYKQKNDFYTLFNFVNENLNESNDLLKYQYKILLVIAKGISPSNDDCFPLKEYALNCVSQSNSKRARTQRLNFFNEILKNKDDELPEKYNEILDYLEERFEITDLKTVSLSGYNLLDIEPLIEFI